jgi:hypothetical protein
MKPKNVPHGTNSKHEIIIPELEEAARIYTPKHRGYTDEELSVISEYYGRVPTIKLAGYLKRSVTGIQQQASRLGISTAKKGVNDD